MWRFLRNRRLILRLHYYLGTHILGASRGGPCDSTALVVCFMSRFLKHRQSYYFEVFLFVIFVTLLQMIFTVPVYHQRVEDCLMCMCQGISNGSCWHCSQRGYHISAGEPAARIQENGVTAEVSGHYSDIFVYNTQHVFAVCTGMYLTRGLIAKRSCNNFGIQ